MTARPCPFCTLAEDRLVWRSEVVVAIRDGYPVSPGHTLVIPRRHIATWFDASAWEQQEIWRAVAELKRDLDEELAPAGYNIGINAGEAAGQTVMHLHVHLIPRFRGDVDDPRGGVRGIIPGKQRYDAAAPPESGEAHLFASFEGFVPGADVHFLKVLDHGFARADEIDLLAAFVQGSGVDLIEDALIDALARGARVRVLTGDYLGVTDPRALQRLYTLTTAHENIEARLYRVRPLEVFHPKAYIFRRGGQAAAWIGSSNLSRSALTDGVEWNLATNRSHERELESIQERFERLFHAPQSEPLSAELVLRYQARVRVAPTPEPSPPRPVPHAIQQEILRKLAETRAAGQRRGLVVMATGLGKTYLSAFDVAQLGARRALFVAHREEILAQAARSWASVFPERIVGHLVAGKRLEPGAELVFASVQTLSRVKHLSRFGADHFDYVVIDEFHHAAATSYRKLLAHFTPRFLLGLTATPDRLDGAALLELCDDNLVARVGLIEGIARELLVPFRYFGIRDGLDFEAIPWRSGRFDPEALTAAQATKERAAQALREFQRHAPPEPRALIFCSSTRHADFVADFFSRSGVPAAAVHSGPTSASRHKSLERLERGALQALVSVDVFNEGVDLPDVNLILMLRPTESPIIFLQQLGRGLRRGRSIDKPALIVVDFIGNHRSFLVKPQALLALTGVDAAPGEALRRVREGRLDLPEGCSVDVELEALEMLERVARISKDDHLIYTYQTLRAHLGRRPSAAEVFAAGAQMKPVLRRYGTWFHFVEKMGDLGVDEAVVLTGQEAWFRDLTRTPMSRSYKMVTFEVLDDVDALHASIAVDELARRCRDRLRRDPLLRGELAEHTQAGGSLDDLVRRWRDVLLGVLNDAKGDSRRWFALEGDLFRSLLEVPESQRETFDAMTRELVEVRLREYVATKRAFASEIIPLATPIEMIVSHSGGRPILRFDRRRAPQLPEGDVEVLVDGAPYTFRFVKIAVNVATSQDDASNQLPALMWRWFGPTAGQPGTRHRVELLERADGSWRLTRRDPAASAGVVIPLARLPYYPDLAVACGVASPQFAGHDHQEWLAVDTDADVRPKDHFVVRAQGDSMSGGPLSIDDGDLVLCEWMTVTDPGAIEGKPALLTGGAGDEVLATLKIPVRVGGRWVLRSTNPAHPDQALDPGVTLRAVARPLAVVHERAALQLWGLYNRDAIARAFGHTNNPSWRTGHRDVEVGGEQHSILMVNLRKPEDTPIEHRYADAFLSPDEFQWESQSTTTPHSAKGRRILRQAEDKRLIHLFVRFNTKDASGAVEPFTYCGLLRTLRHEGSEPVRVWFRLESPLPEPLWRIWAHLG